jgi:soluble lytic murein transglycosylase-like protein
MSRAARIAAPLATALLAAALLAPAGATERGVIQPAPSRAPAPEPAPTAVPGPTGAQQDPGLRAIVRNAISQAQCFGDRFDSEVWFKLMEPRLRRFVRDHDERIALLQVVYCETHRPGDAPLPPGLVLAVMEVESRFNRWAVSNAGAVGLMQVMPFWPEQLGLRRRELLSTEQNIRMGCAILRYYLEMERNDVRRALARYNGSTGRREYPDLVVTRWTRYWAGADDLGRRPIKPS